MDTHDIFHQRYNFLLHYNHVHLTTHAWKTGNKTAKLLLFTESKYLHFTLPAAFATWQFCRQLHVSGSDYTMCPSIDDNAMLRQYDCFKQASTSSLEEPNLIGYTTSQQSKSQQTRRNFFNPHVSVLECLICQDLPAASQPGQHRPARLQLFFIAAFSSSGRCAWTYLVRSKSTGRS